MKNIINIILKIALVVSLFISIDLAINVVGSLIPKMSDGIPFNSVLQNWFGLLEGKLQSRTDFFNAFASSLWVLFVISVLNIAFSIFNTIKSK